MKRKRKATKRKPPKRKPPKRKPPKRKPPKSPKRVAPKRKPPKRKLAPKRRPVSWIAHPTGIPARKPAARKPTRGELPTRKEIMRDTVPSWRAHPTGIPARKPKPFERRTPKRPEVKPQPAELAAVKLKGLRSIPLAKSTINTIKNRIARLGTFRIASDIGVKVRTLRTWVREGRVSAVYRPMIENMIVGTRIPKETAKQRKIREAFELSIRQQERAKRRFKVQTIEDLKIELDRLWNRYKGGNPPNAHMRGLARAVGMRVEAVWRLYKSPEPVKRAA